MKKLFSPLIVMLIFFTASAQQNDAIVINPAKQNQEELIKKMYQYPQFVHGKALAKDGEVAEAKFNYSYLTNRIYFINPKEDTLELSNGEHFSQLVIDSDTFHYYNKEFIQQVTHNLSLNLYVKRSLRNTGSEKKGAYDTYSGNSAISNVNTIVDNRLGTINLSADVNITFVFKELYFLSGRFGQFYPATKKGLYDLFPKKEKQIREFLEKNNINLNKREDIEKLVQYVNASF